MPFQSPTLSPKSALSLLLKLANEGLELSRGDPTFDECEIWHNQVSGILLRVLGETHDVAVFADVMQEYPSYDPNEKREALAVQERGRALRKAIVYLGHNANIIDALDGSIDSLNEQPIAIVERICMAFPAVVRQLGQRRENRQTLVVNDEYDVQDLMHALLRVHFDDIRREEWTPSYAGSASRVDFLLKKEKIVLEVKMTRTGLRDGDVGQQFIIDRARYAGHPDCRMLVCFVYDLRRYIQNPEGLRRDLEQISSEEMQVRVIVAT